jgi:hypothetical protein
MTRMERTYFRPASYSAGNRGTNDDRFCPFCAHQLAQRLELRTFASWVDMQFFDEETMPHFFHARILSVAQPETAA